MEVDLSTPQERLEYFIYKAFKSKTEFAKAMNMNPSDVQRYTKNGKSVFQTSEKHEKLASLGMNVAWYKNGEGNMLLQQQQQQQQQQQEQQRQQQEQKRQHQKAIDAKQKAGHTFLDVSNLPVTIVYDLPAHANVGSLVGFYDLPISYYPFKFSGNDDEVIGIKVLGDSMKDARIFDGTVAFFAPNSEAYNGAVVVVILNGVILIKKFERKEDGTIFLHSAHNDVESIVCNEIDDQLTVLGVFKGSYNHA